MTNTTWAVLFAAMATVYLLRTVYITVRDSNVPKWDALLAICSSAAFVVALTRCSDYFKIH